jgi:hypothetical protein
MRSSRPKQLHAVRPAVSSQYGLSQSCKKHRNSVHESLRILFIRLPALLRARSTRSVSASCPAGKVLLDFDCNVGGTGDIFIVESFSTIKENGVDVGALC